MNKRQIDLFHKLDVKFNRLSFREHLIVGEAIKELQKQIEIDAEQIRALQKQNGELTDKVCLSIDCEKAKKNGELCLGYGDDEDEPCEQCKNCIKCECGYYQLGETEKDEQLTKAKEIIKTFLGFAEAFGYSPSMDKFITETKQFLKDSEVK